MNTPTFWNSFFDELEKLSAIAPRDLPKGVEVKSSFDDFKRELQPGDVFISKPSTPGWKSRIIAFRQMIGLNANYRWSHSGMYLGDGKVIHASIPASGKPGPSEVRVEHIDDLNKGKLDLMILKPKVAPTWRTKAVSIAKKLEGLAYDSKALIGVTLGLPLGNDPIKDPEALLCTAVPAIAYPQLEITEEQKSRRHLLPIDLIHSKDFTPTVAFSQGK